jgi:hypothetical protein
VIGSGFTDSGFVGLSVMGLGVANGAKIDGVWLILCLVLGFVQWVLVGCGMGHGGFLWRVSLAVGQGVSWWVCGVARGGSQWW